MPRTADTKDGCLIRSTVHFPEGTAVRDIRLTWGDVDTVCEALRLLALSRAERGMSYLDLESMFEWANLEPDVLNDFTT